MLIRHEDLHQSQQRQSVRNIRWFCLSPRLLHRLVPPANDGARGASHINEVQPDPVALSRVSGVQVEDEVSGLGGQFDPKPVVVLSQNTMPDGRVGQRRYFQSLQFLRTLVSCPT